MAGMEAVSKPAADPGGPLVCRVTSWYFRRMGILGGMLLLMGLYFVYDGKYGYPKANVIAERKDWFEKELLASYDKAKASGRLDQWLAEAREKGWPTGSEGEPPKWAAYAARNNWPEKPKKFTAKEIEEQFWWGGGTILGSLIVGVLLLLNRNKTLQGGDDHFVTPEGRRIAFAEVFRIDKRKWDNKGLAYAWYREGGSGPERKAVIDDLKFDGAGRILNRLLVSFSGELIEKVADESVETGGNQPAESTDGAGDLSPLGTGDGNEVKN